ncbi:MAG: bacterial Ig-like domain-containing protein [Bacteroidales bacterium]|nr:bacterial Ig-like domain-containing protein [Bacteroidales bacterium]
MKKTIPFFLLLLITIIAAAQNNNTENTLSIPTVFSPQSDDQNINTFHPTGSNLATCEISVYDKWGIELWHSDEIVNGEFVGYWDGKQNGEFVKPDTYIWKMEATFLDGEVWEGIDDGNGNKTKFGSVIVLPKPSVTIQSITVQAPTKLYYYIGENFDSNGLSVVANYSDGSSDTVFDYDISGFDSQIEGESVVTITYQNYTETFSVYIQKKEDITEIQSVKPIAVWNVGRLLCVSANPQTKIIVFSMSGQKIHSSTMKQAYEELSIQKQGCYIVVADGMRFKICVE